MNLDNAIIEAVKEIMPSYGLEPNFIDSSVEVVLSSSSQVNVIIGLTDGMRGNIIFAMDKSAANRIASAMVAGLEGEELEELAESAVVEMANMFVGIALGKLDKAVFFTPPTVAIGENIYLMISKVESKKLVFDVDGEKFIISYCTE